MTISSRILCLLAGAFLIVTPLYAQSNSDVSGAVPASDVSGNLTQSDLFYFQSDESKIRMAEVSASLARALREGTLGASVTSVGPMEISESTAALFLAESRKDRRLNAETFAESLMAAGIPSSEARSLATEVAGVLEGETVDSDRFAAALLAFNEVVDVAPKSFLTAPPTSFVVVRIVLTTLLDAAGSA